MSRSRRFAALGAAWQVWRSARSPGGLSLGDRFAAAPRMALATLTGRYSGLAKARLGFFALAVAYILSPVDLLPEAAFWVFGVADDIGVAAWLAGDVLLETDRFLTWERERGRVLRGEVVEPG
ncbi:MAG: YkvA family protein [Actinomycetes bacterium]